MDRITSRDILGIFKLIEAGMQENKEHLIALDSIGGDGDLGISMCQGFGGVVGDLSAEDVSGMETKAVVMKAAMAINEHSPSSLGTILCAGMLGGAKAIDPDEKNGTIRFRDFVDGSMNGIMSRAGSKRGEKTILDAIGGALDALNRCVASGDSLEHAAAAAAAGSLAGMESTKDMDAVHGRAAYQNEKMKGHVDGGATVGMLIFRAIDSYLNRA